MSRWAAKAIVQKIISYLPYKYKLNRFFQKYVTKGLALNNQHFENKIMHARDHVTYLLKYFDHTQLKCLELGTGWYPIIPISLYLNGLETVYTIDVASHVRAESIRNTVEKFMEWERNGELKAYLPALNEVRWEAFLQFYQQMYTYDAPTMLQFFNIKPIVGDACKTEFPSDFFDFICSNNTFEHVYPAVLLDILKEFNRILKGEGIMSHFIDMSDHFAHFDTSITIYNFLQYSNTAWQWIDNDIQPQNRLRLPVYKQMHQKAGFKIIEESVRPGNVKEVEKLQIANVFKQFTVQELAISHAYLVSKK